MVVCSTFSAKVLKAYTFILYVYRSYPPLFCTHFLPCPKIGPGPKNDQKWVFIKYGCVTYCWKAHGQEISKSQKKKKKRRAIPSISCPAQKLVHGPNTVGKPIERSFEIFQKLNYPTHFLPYPKIVLRP